MLNRKQRRATAKAGITDSDLKRLQDVTMKQAVNRATADYSVIMAMVLHDKWGFGPVRLQRFLDQVQDLADSINTDYVSIEDCRKVLEAECGVQFR